jgi:hypothetical protein
LAEWLNASVLKTELLARVTGVRIPDSPQKQNQMCRQYPPFYEFEENGVCVKRPPVVEPTTKMEYLATAIVPIGLIFIIYLALSSGKNT